jgi:hypothetical protein
MVLKSFISIRTSHDGVIDPLPPNVIRKPVISHFTRDSIVFVDKTEIDVDSVILATGYQTRKPFLDAGHALVTDPTANEQYQNTSIGQQYALHFPFVQADLFSESNVSHHGSCIRGFTGRHICSQLRLRRCTKHIYQLHDS